ncbi:class I SAM-dependent DNA methyltransferase [Micrococcus sp. HG099]|uniref:Eco57I restriction-modification methylase domain-containing protein n=1 Tax=Micrococcus sp. HG099 TaxID=2969755 RepID=UPI00215B2E62|nr:DNA methyltransferase [Micrococcus sp. HG099]MCR8674695.1 class I SAM-dependent DNA methyltransferase [Micrococcus sp. HG099]
MAVSDAFVVVGEWLSEHYFTSDATKESFRAKVLARRKEWDERASSPRERFTAARGDLERRFGALSEAAGEAAEPADRQAAADAVYDDVLTVLGYRTGEFSLAVDGPVTRVSSAGIEGKAPLAILRARPVDALEDAVAKGDPQDARGTLAVPFVDEAGTEHHSAARALSTLFVDPAGPDFTLLLAGRWAVVAERARWAEGRYLAVDLQTVAERNDAARGGEIDRALTILEAGSLAPDADGAVWWSGVLEESVRHTVGVSEDLREGVRRSIEIIANDVVARRADAGLPPLPGDQAQPLAVQSLRYLYRILFLLYAEASPELGVLPSGAAEYDAGYSVDRLRELTLVELATEQARRGTHLHESLAVLSRLVDAGPRPWTPEQEDATGGLEFHPLRADLFAPAATALIDEVKLSNAALQQVLRHLLLSKERKGRDRGFISYGELGINQLGAVYEGLMSYTGFFAEDELFEVAPGGDASKGSWVVPVDRADHLDRKDFVEEEDPVTHERRPVRHRKGTFVYRLSGRERQQSASYYTPEVLTRFTVQQALEELLDQDGATTSAEDILNLTVCEPALGSGAFAIEAVDQLAREYLTRRQAELGRSIDPEDYPHELQKAKAHIALHQVYGVDLNATAVELAEVSLWLSTMVEGLQAPWFGLRLRRGNSLIGARRSVYSGAQLRKDRAWMKAVPEDRPLSELVDDGSFTSGSVFHFLLPSEGWGSGVEAPKLVRDLVPDEVKALKGWRSSMRRKLSAKQVKELEALTQRADKLWAFALRRLTLAEQQSGRDLDLWGREVPEKRGAVTREQIEESLADQNGAYRRLRRVMDAWCALWFWPLTETEVKPPSMEQWIGALQMLLGVESTKNVRNADTESLASVESWEELDDYELWDRAGTNAVSVEKALEAHPWLAVCEQVAQSQGFFHWELDFAAVFARGGFDLQIGNPPWVRPRNDMKAVLSDLDPWWKLAKGISQEEESARWLEIMQAGFAVAHLVDSVSLTTASSAYFSDTVNFPILTGQPDLYRVFIAACWSRQHALGVTALIHQESHFTDESAALLRMQCYRRLRRHWHFSNQDVLFEGIASKMIFSVNIYAAYRTAVDFMHAAYLYHPSVLTSSLIHTGLGEEPGLKWNNSWDMRAHSSRIHRIDDETLETWTEVFDAPDHRTPQMAYMVGSAPATILHSMATSGRRVGEMPFGYSRGWDQDLDFARGVFARDWGTPPWCKAILSGTFLWAGTPFYKSPNMSMRSAQDVSPIDLEALSNNANPVTRFRLLLSEDELMDRYDSWASYGPASDSYRIAWRKMVKVENERTLTPAIIPPGATHIDGIFSMGPCGVDIKDMITVCGSMMSLLTDFYVRSAPRANLRASDIRRLPAVPLSHPLVPSLLLRTLQLNCLTEAYADLWDECWDPAFAEDEAILPRYGSAVVGKEWTAEVPLRRAEDRRNAQVEIDALVALMLGVDVEDLCTVYRTTFAVLHGYDQDKYTFDRNGRLVPTEVLSVWKKKGERITQEERTAVHPGSGVAYEYELPFATRDREEDFRVAYAEFQRRLQEVQG